MYLSYYNLQDKPFQITTDPRFLWLGEKHQEALATLHYGLFDNKGFLLLTGDVGTGKTTLIKALVQNLDDNTIVATVVSPLLEKMEFFNHLADILGLAHTHNGNWPRTLKETPYNPDFYVLRRRHKDEILPWDFIDHSIRKSFLYKEYQRALRPV